ncbi:hypothetical protein [Motilibacter peucedani]|nr:hypothetical protein [Motilibacter peucedani]
MALLRAVALALGVGALVTGAVAVFVSENETGTAALVVSGVALVGFALLGDRIDSIEGAGVKVLLRKADSKFAQAALAERAGRSEDASRLRGEGQQLLAAAHSLGSEYERVRGAHESGATRTQLMETLMSQGRALAPQLTDVQQVRSAFSAGGDGDRISAIAMMQGRPELADLDCLLDAVEHSRSAFEQYQALKAVRMLLDGGLDARQQRSVLDVLERSSFDGHDRRWFADDIRTRLSGVEGH